jgi:hypothetical protein
MTKVYFSNSYGILREIGNFDETEDEQVAFDCINAFVESKNYKSYYSRVWERNGKTIVDVGSHTEHFEIDWRTDVIEEIWKDIKDYDGAYQISNHGRVKSVSRYIPSKNGSYRKTNERILKQKLSKEGYMHITLKRNKKQKTFLVHRLVAEAFLENNRSLPIVNHIDENKENNFINNLEWCDFSRNALHGSAMEKMIKTRAENEGEKSPKKVIGKPFNDSENVIVVEKLNDVKKYGFHPSAVSSCCNGKRLSHKGYYWNFTQEDNL